MVHVSFGGAPVRSMNVISDRGPDYYISFHDFSSESNNKTAITLDRTLYLYLALLESSYPG
jgi:hypothetical protein